MRKTWLLTLFALLLLVACDKGSELDSEIRQSLPYSLEQKFIGFLEYPGSYDEKIQMLTEFLFRAFYFTVPDEFFDSINEAPAEYVLGTAILSTEPILPETLSDDSLVAYVEQQELSYHRLREHVEQTAVYLFGEDFQLEKDLFFNGFITWHESSASYSLLETSLYYYNPVILSVEETANQYDVVAVFPRSMSYGEEPSYISDSLENVTGSLTDVMNSCLKRRIVIQKNEDGSLTLLSHHILD